VGEGAGAVGFAVAREERRLEALLEALEERKKG
jgi:hypothetical protein